MEKKSVLLQWKIKKPECAVSAKTSKETFWFWILDCLIVWSFGILDTKSKKYKIQKIEYTRWENENLNFCLCCNFFRSKGVYGNREQHKLNQMTQILSCVKNLIYLKQHRLTSSNFTGFLYGQIDVYLMFMKTWWSVFETLIENLIRNFTVFVKFGRDIQEGKTADETEGSFWNSSNDGIDLQAFGGWKSFDGLTYIWGIMAHAKEECQRWILTNLGFEWLSLRHFQGFKFVDWIWILLVAVEKKIY